MEKVKKETAFSRLRGYAGNYAGLIWLSLILSSLSAVIGLLPFVYLWRIIEEVIAVFPDFSRAESIVWNGWLAVLLAVGAWIIYIGALMCSHIAAFRVASNIKRSLLKHISTLPVGFCDEIGSGKVRRIVTETAGNTETFLAHNLPDMANALATPMAMLVLLFIYDWRVGIACLLPVVASFAVMRKMTGADMQEDMKKYQNALGDMSNEAVEYIRGIPVVKTFGQTVFSFKRFKQTIDDYSHFCLHYTKSNRQTMMMYTVLINSTFVTILLLTMLLIGYEGYGQDLLLNFLFYVIFTPAIATAMNRIMFMSENTMRINDAIERIDSIMEIAPLDTNDGDFLPQDGSVKLKNVTYTYKHGNMPAVNSLSLSVDNNQIVALVGPSGSGKTTIAGLISRYFDPQSGQVEIGNVDVRNISKEQLMKEIAYVFQDSRLLKRSIAENLRIAKPDATDEELLTVLRKAHCMDIIERLPEGIDTVLGSRGTYLSGGEQQRIAIARAMLKNSKIVILDEASAFTDPECEREIQKAFMEMAKDKTVIMIAHRLSTVVNADMIYVLNGGVIEECGNHGQLLEQNGLYRKMWEEYQNSINWKVGEAVC